MTDAPEKIWVWYEPEQDDAQWSEWPDDQAFEGYAFKGVYLLTPPDALAAREARDKRVRGDALREAAAGIKEHTDTARNKMRMAYGTPSSDVWSAIISHLDIEHDRILTIIAGDQTDETI